MNKTVKLGEGPEVGRIGYGTMQLPGKGVWGESEDPAGAVEVLRKAVDLGIDFFDTADSYGPFVAEDLLRSTSLSVTSIAHRVGYGSEEAFSRAFKRDHGSAPSVWRPPR